MLPGALDGQAGEDGAMDGLLGEVEHIAEDELIARQAFVFQCLHEPGFDGSSALFGGELTFQDVAVVPVAVRGHEGFGSDGRGRGVVGLELLEDQDVGATAILRGLQYGREAAKFSGQLLRGPALDSGSGDREIIV